MCLSYLEQSCQTNYRNLNSIFWKFIAKQWSSCHSNSFIGWRLNHSDALGFHFNLAPTMSFKNRTNDLLHYLNVKQIFQLFSYSHGCVTNRPLSVTYNRGIWPNVVMVMESPLICRGEWESTWPRLSLTTLKHVCSHLSPRWTSFSHCGRPKVTLEHVLTSLAEMSALFRAAYWKDRVSLTNFIWGSLHFLYRDSLPADSNVCTCSTKASAFHDLTTAVLLQHCPYMHLMVWF